MPKTIDELGEELCDHCELEANERGVRNYGNGPIFCSESPFCDSAYQNYLDNFKEEDNAEQ